jgi:hypothetical protein
VNIIDGRIGDDKEALNEGSRAVKKVGDLSCRTAGDGCIHFTGQMLVKYWANNGQMLSSMRPAVFYCFYHVYYIAI